MNEEVRAESEDAQFLLPLPFQSAEKREWVSVARRSASWRFTTQSVVPHSLPPDFQHSPLRG